MTVNSVPKPVKKAKSKKKKPVKLTLTKLRLLEKREIKKLTAECRSLCSVICKKNWGGKCAVCGQEGTAAHHFWGWKACSNLRFSLDNLIWMCYYDHIGKVHQQGLTEPAREAMIRRIGQERFDKLKEIAFKEHKYSIDELESIRDLLQEEVTPSSKKGELKRKAIQFCAALNLEYEISG